ncbi:MAG: response regulator, partial [Candidatus Obscuribacterales bacterium]|nr:response regulator [Candidatus Obscuribacterales bacterium]
LLDPLSSPALWKSIEALLDSLVSAMKQEPVKNLPDLPASNARFSAEVLPARGSSSLAKVLLIDDDPFFTKYVQKIAAQRLVDLQYVHSVSEAYPLLQSNSFDALIVDLNLGPGIDACSLILELRRELQLMNLPMAFISASGSPEERLRAVQAGAVLFLEKPLEPEHFEAAIQQLLLLRQECRSKILIVEDSDVFAKVLTLMLQRNQIDVERARDGSDILAVLNRVRPELLLLDLNLPGLNGFEICRLIRATPDYQTLPIIIVTAESGWQTRVNCFREGADDYISKPLVEEELISKVESRLERFRFLNERNSRDTITGVLVRTAFIQELHQMFRRSRGRERGPVSIVILDLDSFKKVNDLGGHLIGDSVLASFGRLLLSSFRRGDLRGRWGGDEFILAFEDTGKKEAAILLQNLLNEFRRLEFANDRGEKFKMSFSAGIAQYPDEGSSAYELLKLADERLYASKAAGRSRVNDGEASLAADL